MPDSVLAVKVGALWTFPPVLFRHLVCAEPQPEAEGAGSERQRLGGLWSPTSVCGTEAPVLQPAEALVSAAQHPGSSPIVVPFRNSLMD